MKRLMAKAVATVEEKDQSELDQQTSADLLKSFEEVMSELDTFVKSGKQAQEKKEEIIKEEKPSKVITKAKQAEEDEIDEDELEAEDTLKKSVEAEDQGALDGIQVFKAFKKSIQKSIEKSVADLREALIGHIDERLTEVLESQVVVAKALNLHGKLSKEMIRDIAAFGQTGRGRKSVLTLMDKAMSGNGGTATEETEEKKLDINAILTKAVDLSAQKKISPSDVAQINHYVTGGMGIPAQYKKFFE